MRKNEGGTIMPRINKVGIAMKEDMKKTIQLSYGLTLVSYKHNNFAYNIIMEVLI